MLLAGLSRATRLIAVFLQEKFSLVKAEPGKWYNIVLTLWLFLATTSVCRDPNQEIWNYFASLSEQQRSSISTLIEHMAHRLLCQYPIQFPAGTPERIKDEIRASHVPLYLARLLTLEYLNAGMVELSNRRTLESNPDVAAVFTNSGPFW